nr:MAG TPA: hypothetical protein [Caudoviricetes sp.]
MTERLKPHVLTQRERSVVARDDQPAISLESFVLTNNPKENTI